MRSSWRLIALLALALVFMFSVSALAAEKVFKVGVQGPFTGPSAKTGAEFKGSVQSALEKINYKIGDYKIEVVWVDCQSDPAKAASAYAEACERGGIQAGVLNWHSSVAVALMDVANQYKVPHMFGFGATEVVNEKYTKNKINYWNAKGWPVPAKLMSGYIEALNNAISTGKWKPANKKVAIFGEDTDWGRSAGGALKKNFKDAGWEISSEDYFPTTQTDFVPLMSKYKKDAVSVLAGTSASPPSMSAFVKQAHEAGLKAMIAADGVGWMGDWYKLTGAASDYVLDMIPQLTTKEAQAWAEAVKAKLGYTPSPSAGGLSYDYMNFFIKALKRTLERDGKLDKESVYKTITDEINTGKLTYTKADGALIMNEYKYTAESVPDPVLARNAYFFPVIQYKGGVGSIIYPDDWKTKEFESKK